MYLVNSNSLWYAYEKANDIVSFSLWSIALV